MSSHRHSQVCSQVDLDQGDLQTMGHTSSCTLGLGLDEDKRIDEVQCWDPPFFNQIYCARGTVPMLHITYGIMSQFVANSTRDFATGPEITGKSR